MARFGLCGAPGRGGFFGHRHFFRVADLACWAFLVVLKLFCKSGRRVPSGRYFRGMQTMARCCLVVADLAASTLEIGHRWWTSRSLLVRESLRAAPRHRVAPRPRRSQARVRSESRGSDKRSSLIHVTARSLVVIRSHVVVVVSRGAPNVALPQPCGFSRCRGVVDHERRPRRRRW